MKHSSILLLLAVLCFSCKDPFLGQLFVTEDEDVTKITNIAYLEKYPEVYSLFLEFLDYADYYNALNDASTVVTVFAPNNEAMKEFMQFKGIESFSELEKDYARQVVQVHVLRGSLSETSFIQYLNDGLIEVPTLFGDYLEPSYGYLNTDVDDAELAEVAPKDTLTIYLNNQASVLEMAHQTANGMIYQVGGVLRPLNAKVFDKLKDYGEYGIFADAIKATKWDSLLSITADTTWQLLGSYTVNAVNYTLFAVPDEVYRQAGITSLADLASHLGAGTNYTDSANALHRYVSYHILDGLYTKETLTASLEEGQRSIIDTNEPQEVISFERHDSVYYINGDAETGCQFVRSNIKAFNGMIHKVNGVMPVYCPEPVTVIWDFCNSPDIISMANAYGAATNLGDIFYTPVASSENKVDISEKSKFGTATSFVYKAASPANKSWANVTFLKCRQGSDATLPNEYNAHQNNLFVLNLGYTGWIEMRTPTIVRGKYRVELHYSGAKVLASKLYGPGSLVKITLDDYLKPLYTWKGWSSTDHVVKGDCLFEALEFEYTGTHSFKAVMMDPNASSNSLYRQQWDYVKFIPVTE